ncbi:MAG: DEAD/DEAH box helicase, partial [Acidobacteriota bacterium]
MDPLSAPVAPDAVDENREPAPDPATALAPFDPLVRTWFETQVGTPTDAQARAWPRIASDEHVLVTAPTGSGKTLTAFLWALDRLLTGAWEGGRVRVVYVSPLRALNTDVRRNLLGPLAALRGQFELAGREMAPVNAQTRSGDTPAKERQRMLRRPPEILITTPESLNILLISPRGRRLFDDVRTIVLDEIHAVAPTKRGVHLITAVEWVARQTLRASGREPQRVALSATVRPAERIAAYVGGQQIVAPGDADAELPTRFAPRPVTVVRSAATKRYAIAVHFPLGPEEMPAADADASTDDATDADAVADPGAAMTDDATADDELGAVRAALEGAPAAKPPSGPDERPDASRTVEDDNAWSRLAAAFKGHVDVNRSTLLFANSRRTTEKVARLLNAGETSELAYSHHGSLSRAVRAVAGAADALHRRRHAARRLHQQHLV